MPVEKRSGRSSPADILERVFDGGIVIDASDRVSVTPELSVQALEDARARKARLAAAQMMFEAIIARCALEQTRQKTHSPSLTFSFSSLAEGWD